MQQTGELQTCLDCGADNTPADTVCASCGASLDLSAARALVGSVVLGVYEIVDILGQGGMSVVYKGRHKLTDQVVALKILPPELAVHAGLRARFLEEAKALARLEHPNIVRLYHFGEEGGRFVLAMQLVEGQTFERMIFRTKRVGWREATRITTEVLKALEYAHERGVIHRDIKPSNVIVRKDGTAMVMDFGIAKINNDSSRLTATGQTMGTVRYMSPEQVRGQTVDHRSDVYSVGVALYEALVGDTPFDGDTHFDIMTKHLNEPPEPPSERGVTLPAELELALLQSLAKAPDARFQTATDFRVALEAVLAQDAPPNASPRPVAAVKSAQPVRAPEIQLSGTGLADALEPTRGAETQAAVAAIRRRSPVLWLLLAVLVLGASAAVIVVMMQRRGAGGAGDEAGIARAWTQPFLVAGLEAQTDQRFEEPALVRVIATTPVDAKHLADTYVAARKRFEDYLVRKSVGHAAEVHPLNLVVVPGHLMCKAELFGGAAPPDCAELRYHYLAKEKTLYVLSSENLETINLPQGASVHLCSSTLALLEIGCKKNLLPPFWDEVEAAPGRQP